MKEYTREDLVITKFDTEDVITTSGIGPGGGGDPTDPFSPTNPGEDWTDIL